MAVHEEKYLDFAAAHALGVLGNDELDAFERHMKSGCGICRNEVQAFSRTANILPLALSQVKISPEVKEKLFFNLRLAEVAKAEIEEREQREVEGPPEGNAVPETPPTSQHARNKTGTPWLSFGLAVAVVIMLVGFGLYITKLLGTIQEQNEFIVQQESRIVESRTELDQQKAILHLLQGQANEIINMKGSNVYPGGYGKIIWDPARRIALLQVAQLPLSPQGKEYQLWVIRQKEPVNAGTFKITSKQERDNFFRIQPLEIVDKQVIDGFMVTLEPDGGSSQPSGEMYLIGTTSTN